jgi:hypothetical protein
MASGMPGRSQLLGDTNTTPSGHTARWVTKPRPGSPPRVRLPPRPRPRLQPHTLDPLVTPVPEPSYRLVHEIQPGQVNEARFFYVGHELTKAILDACPDEDWRLIIALCRFGGLRCPTERQGLTWVDIDWGEAGGRVVIKAKKTATRSFPLWQELRPHLAAAFERAEPGAVYVVPRCRQDNANLRTQFLRILDRAGIPSWPRLFQNLRSSRETELTHFFPLHLVCKWIGNSEAVAKKHYLQMTEEDFEKATQIPTHGFTALGCTNLHQETRTAVSPAFARDTAVKVPPRGVEPRFSD